MEVKIKQTGQGWIIVEADRLSLTIHPKCGGSLGRVRDAALTLRDLLAAIQKNIEETKRIANG